MLHEMLTANQDELVRRCKAKVSKRSPATVAAVVENGVPIFLQQLIDTLEHEQLTKFRQLGEPEPAPAGSPMARSAALHGADLLAKGYSVDQVVRDYGDVCQTVTDMAIEQKAKVTADEFRTLNRCLDDAMAEAVASYGGALKKSTDHDARALNLRLGSFVDEQYRLIDIAIQSFSAIKTGNIGVGGATGALLVHTLLELRSIARKALAELGSADTSNGK